MEDANSIRGKKLRRERNIAINLLKIYLLKSMVAVILTITLSTHIGQMSQADCLSNNYFRLWYIIFTILTVALTIFRVYSFIIVSKKFASRKASKLLFRKF